MPKLHIVAGPNGSGKTTFAREFLPKYAQCSNFINADLIAMGLSPFKPAQVQLTAGKILLKQVDDMLHNRKDFAFESTLAGKTYVRLIKEAKALGYTVHIYYLWIPSADLAKERIKQRVKQGGHHVPSVDVDRRYPRSLSHFLDVYGPMVDSWEIFDNAEGEPRVIAKRDEKSLMIVDEEMYHLLHKGKDSS